MFNKKDEEKEERETQRSNKIKSDNENLTENRDPEEIKKENKSLFEKLTNKNQDYFVQLSRRLDELSYDKENKIIVLNQMIRETIDFQEDAITARKMYGTVTESANQVLGLDPELLGEEEEKSPTKLLYLDGALLLGGIFSVVNGFSAWQSIGVDGNRSLNLIQLIMNFILGGFVALALTKYRPEPGKTKGMMKYIGVTVGAMMLFVFLITLAETIAPSIINPEIPPLLVVGIGIVAIGLKWYLKKKLDIQGTLF